MYSASSFIWWQVRNTDIGKDQQVQLDENAACRNQQEHTGDGDEQSPQQYGL